MISVIIAVYNSEKYLEECLNSILEQTYKDYEVILVDDGSTDSSGKICDRYSEEHDNFHVIHKANGKQASARNAGIEIAKGDYLTFIDSDDRVDSDMFEGMLEAINSDSRITFVNCGMHIHQDDGTVITRKSDTRSVFDKESAFIEFFKVSGKITGSFADKLIKREVFDKGLRFNEEVGSEDTEIVPRLLDLSDMVLTDDHAYYHYLKHENSTSEKKKFSIRIYRFIPVLGRFKEVCTHRYPDILPWFDYYMANTYNGMYMYLKKCDDAASHPLIALKLRTQMLISALKAKHHEQVKALKEGPLGEYILRAILGEGLFRMIIR